VVPGELVGREERVEGRCLTGQRHGRDRRFRDRRVPRGHHRGDLLDRDGLPGPHLALDDQGYPVGGLGQRLGPVRGGGATLGAHPDRLGDQDP
jgi:hypothetical protein